MKVGQVLASVNAWQKLCVINMKPKIALAIMRYTKIVEAEVAIINQKRDSLVKELSTTKDNGSPAIEANTPEMDEFLKRFNDHLMLDSPLPKIELKLSEVVDAADETQDSLSVQNLALLESFFADFVEPVTEKVDE